MERIGAYIYGHDSGETKVTQFDLAVGINQYISRFNVPMKHIARMQKVYCTKRVIEYCDDVLFVKINLLGTIEDLLQI